MNYTLVQDPPTEIELKCHHCGQPCEETLWLEDKAFCCYGCKTVFEILSANNLCEYYRLDGHAGETQRNKSKETFAYLDDAAIRKKLLLFDSPDFAKVTFYVPAIHCVSCIWLLENLQKIDAGIVKSEVNFGKKTVTVDYDPKRTMLGRIAEHLSSVGYAPRINLDAHDTPKSVIDRSLVIKLALAGFCFGNVMLFSFPEYLGLDENDVHLMRIFSWLNLALSVPVLMYSAAEYFTAAGRSFRQRQINIDVPIAAGLLALFFRSAYDIVTATGPGYLDSFTGLVFFLLIGRWFQSKTYESLAFDRDYKSYFPLAVEKNVGSEWKPVIIYELDRGDTIRLRNMEIVPSDGVLMDGTAYFDYSFVTGESRPVKIGKGESVFAGGRLVGQPVELVIQKKTSQSHLTSLWNNGAFRKVNESRYQKTIDKAARAFTWVVMGIAVGTAVYWKFYNPDEMWLVLTSVLMVACPCALALAAPFTYGSMLRAFGRHNLYLKNADVIERMATIDTVVFDKTGTVTHGNEPDVAFVGELMPVEREIVQAMARSSSHPLSRLISSSIVEVRDVDFARYNEIPGKGIEAEAEGHLVRLGSREWLRFEGTLSVGASHVFVQVDGVLRGYFVIKTSLRKNIKDMLGRLGRKCAALLSGDNEADRVTMVGLFGSSAQLMFNQTPQDKLEFIRTLQAQGKRVLMVGDGLNDSGALAQSDVGLAVTDDTGVFTPASDGILQGNQLASLDRFLALAKSSSQILKIAFGISFFYNAVALSFAVSGNLTPLVAAILMPISSISVVGFSSLAVNFTVKREMRKASNQKLQSCTSTEKKQLK